MTAPEMKYNFELELERIAADAAPGYTDREVSALLTRAQERLVKRHITPFGNKYNEGFEATEDRRKELSRLTKGPYDDFGQPLTTKASDQTHTLKNGVIYRLPSDLWLTIWEDAVVTSNDDCSDLEKDINDDGEKEKLKYASIDPISHDEVQSNRYNPFRKPKNTRLWRLDHSVEEDNIRFPVHELITDGTFDVHEYRVRYIRRLQPIITGPLNDPIYGYSNTTDSELDESFHPEIVAEAAAMAASMTQPELYQLRRQEAQLEE